MWLIWTKGMIQLLFLVRLVKIQILSYEGPDIHQIEYRLLMSPWCDIKYLNLLKNGISYVISHEVGARGEGGDKNCEASTKICDEKWNWSNPGGLIRRWLTRVKRNPECWIENIQESPESESNGEECGEKIENFLGVATVSYTHLTLPTIYSV